VEEGMQGASEFAAVGLSLKRKMDCLQAVQSVVSRALGEYRLDGLSGTGTPVEEGFALARLPELISNQRGASSPGLMLNTVRTVQCSCSVFGVQII
jgi:hypothetical protein